jgi:hypothetical protein
MEDCVEFPCHIHLEGAMVEMNVKVGAFEDKTGIESTKIIKLGRTNTGPARGGFVGK